MSNKNLIYVFIITLLLSIGLSYSYFTAILTSDEETSIEVGSGIIKLIYDGGKDINITNLIPGDQPVVKNFTVTGYNNTYTELSYKINFIIEENSFSNGSLKYKLKCINNNKYGFTLPEVNTFENINNETISLGSALFFSPTNGEKKHFYVLEIYFLEVDYNQNIDQGKVLKGYIEITL